MVGSFDSGQIHTCGEERVTTCASPAAKALLGPLYEL